MGRITIWDSHSMILSATSYLGDNTLVLRGVLLSLILAHILNLCNEMPPSILLGLTHYEKLLHVNVVHSLVHKHY